MGLFWWFFGFGCGVGFAYFFFSPILITVLRRTIEENSGKTLYEEIGGIVYQVKIDKRGSNEAE